MPELPEVESIKLQLNKKLKGRKIKNVSYDWPKGFYWGKYSIEDLRAAKIVGVRRLGKVIIIDLLNTKGLKTKAKKEKFSVSPSSLDVSRISILFHLKMTGQIILQKDSDRIAGGHPIPPLNQPVPNSTTRAVLKLDDSSIMYFNDLRKFGWIKIMPTSEVTGEPLIKTLGPDPLSIAFSVEYLSKNLKQKSQAVKLAIMDQKLAPGVGNIYASEALFLAKVKPQKKASALSRKEIEAVHDGIIEALKTGVKYGGASAAAYIKPDGNEGVYLKYANVYNRAGEPCKVCKKPIEKIKLGQRGTYYCSSCQV